MARRSDHNYLPLHKWPFKYGSKVLYLKYPTSQHIKLHHLRLVDCMFTGKVHFYNPAIVGNCVISKGCPIYNIDGQLVDARYVFANTKQGRAAAIATFVTELQDALEYQIKCYSQVLKDTQEALANLHDSYPMYMGAQGTTVKAPQAKRKTGHG